VTARTGDDRPRVAVVTGAAAGLGEGVAARLAEDGWAVALLDINPAVEVTAARLAATNGLPGGRLVPMVVDVAEADAVGDALTAVLDAFGSLDLLVANAGIGGPSDDVVDIDVDAWDRVMAVNLRGAFLTARSAARAMRRQGSGVIVLLGSMFGQDPVAGGGAYSASKAGVEALGRSLALELAPDGIRVNTIAPGNMATGMHWEELRYRASRSGRTFEEEVAAARADVPLGRHGTGTDIGAVVAFLASDDASYITGQTISVNGGILRR